MRKLLTVLENIEKCEQSSNVPTKTPAIGVVNGKPNGNAEKTGKRKGMSSSRDRIPKKARTEKHCALYQKYGGAHMTHNTEKCSKYEKDRTEKAGWSSKLPSNSAGKYKNLTVPMHNFKNASTSVRKPSRKEKKVLLLVRRSITIVAIVLPTRIDELGRVVQGN